MILFIIWAVFWSGLVILGIWQAWQTFLVGIAYVRRLHQIPCSSCVYFTGDYRLKCTVHPLAVLTEDSINCRDFEPIFLCQKRRQNSYFLHYLKTFLYDECKSDNLSKKDLI